MMKNVRQYGLFEMRDKKWVQVSELTFPKQQAIRVFQNRLLNGFMSGVKTELRVIPKKKVLA